MEINSHLELIREKIASAAAKVNRSADAIQLIAVSKTQPLEVLAVALELGLRDLGESKVQEARLKVDRFGSRARWHLIGHLQKNKVKEAVRLFDFFDAVDSLELAEEISHRADEVGRTFPVLLQVNVSGESTKYGIKPFDAPRIAAVINALPRIELRGLMTMAPYSEEPERARPVFAGLRECRDAIEKETGLKLPELSMGMSGDFEVAIEEGSTQVRIGTTLFGERRAAKLKRSFEDAGE